MHVEQRGAAAQDRDQVHEVPEIPLDHYVALYELSPAVIATTNQLEGVPEMDRRGHQMTGGGDPPIGHSLLERMAEATRDALRRAMAPTSISGGDRHLLVAGVAPAVEQVISRSESRVAPTGNEKSWRSGADTSEPQQAETDLARAGAILERANRAARIGFWDIDIEHSRTVWSAVTREIYELPPSVEPDLASAIGFGPGGAGGDRLRSAMAAAIAEGEPYDLELKITTCRGEDRWIRVIGVADVVDGRCRRLYGTVQDVDARVRAEEARVAQVRAEAARGLKTQLLSQIGHELRTPLNAVLGFAQLLAADRNEPPSPRHKAWILHIERAGSHLVELIDDALSHSARERD